MVTPVCLMSQQEIAAIWDSIKVDPFPLMDDGFSQSKYRNGWAALGVVAFARGKVPWWVTPIFQMET